MQIEHRCSLMPQTCLADSAEMREVPPKPLGAQLAGATLPAEDGVAENGLSWCPKQMLAGLHLYRRLERRLWPGALARGGGGGAGRNMITAGAACLRWTAQAAAKSGHVAKLCALSAGWEVMMLRREICLVDSCHWSCALNQSKVSLRSLEQLSW